MRFPKMGHNQVTMGFNPKMVSWFGWFGDANDFEHIHMYFNIHTNLYVCGLMWALVLFFSEHWMPKNISMGILGTEAASGCAETWRIVSRPVLLDSAWGLSASKWLRLRHLRKQRCSLGPRDTHGYLIISIYIYIYIYNIYIYIYPWESWGSI